MPKIIENVRGMLIKEAKKQIELNGYESVTIRSIAKGCGIGLGTFYNYFKSKDKLISTFLYEDWIERIIRVTEDYIEEKDPMVVIRALHEEVNDFITVYEGIFTSPAAIKTFSAISPEYHGFVRKEVAGPIYNSCVLAEFENAEFLSLFVAESVVTWTVAHRDYKDIEAIVSKLFVK